MHLKTTQLPLTVVTVLLMVVCFDVEVDGRVSPNFNGCSQFFLGQSQPSGFPDTDASFRDICQNNNYGLPDVLATLYDTKHKIPTYSAYIMDRSVLSGRPKEWHTERDIDPSKQAHDGDYKYNNLDKGHLCPSIYISKTHRPAAYTLTNAVPQYGFFNQRMWNKAEQTGQKIMLKSCAEGTAYFITGAIPGPRTMKTKHGSQIFDTGVTIPTHMFTAACCKLNNGDSFSFGYLGRNVVTNETTKYKEVMSVMDVKLLGRKVMQDYYHSMFPDPIEFFNDQCNYSNTTAVNVMAKALKVSVTSSGNSIAVDSRMMTMIRNFYLVGAAAISVILSQYISSN